MPEGPGDAGLLMSMDSGPGTRRHCKISPGLLVTGETAATHDGVSHHVQCEWKALGCLVLLEKFNRHTLRCLPTTTVTLILA